MIKKFSSYQHLSKMEFHRSLFHELFSWSARSLCSFGYWCFGTWWSFVAIRLKLLGLLIPAGLNGVPFSFHPQLVLTMVLRVCESRRLMKFYAIVWQSSYHRLIDLFYRFIRHSFMLLLHSGCSYFHFLHFILTVNLIDAYSALFWSNLYGCLVHKSLVLSQLHFLCFSQRCSAEYMRRCWWQIFFFRVLHFSPISTSISFMYLRQTTRIGTFSFRIRHLTVLFHSRKNIQHILCTHLLVTQSFIWILRSFSEPNFWNSHKNLQFYHWHFQDLSNYKLFQLR